MSPNTRPSDRVTLLGVVDPQSATTAKSTAWVPMAGFFAFLAKIKAGAFATNATLDAKVECAEDGSGTNPEDVVGLAITQMTEAGTDDNKQALINFTPDQVASQFPDATHVRLTITPAVAAVLVDGELLGFDARQQPAAHAATVDEVV